jgi:phospholipid transport system substrate-binding protein
MSAKLNSLFAILAVFVLTVGFSSVTPAYGQNNAEAIMTKLKERDQEIKTMLGDKNELSEPENEKLKNLVNGIIDFGQMAEDALGDEWDKLTSEQHAEFVKVFSEIVRGKSLNDLEIYRLEVQYDDIKLGGDSAHVYTSTVYKDQPMKVEYALGLRDAEWRVDDIILDGVSTTEGYARSFQTYMRKRGFDALMTNLQKRLDKMNAAS